MSVPLFSVITPFLDEERYLAEAIESVLGQSIEDWELLLIDDGSRDGSAAIAARFAAADPRIRLLRHPDGARRGAAASRNLGLREARGRFVAFLDGDDRFLPDRLADHAEILARYPGLCAVYGPARWVYEETGTWRDENAGPSAGQPVEPPRLLRSTILDQDYPVPCICSISISRDAALECGGFEEEFELYEDQTLLVKLFAGHAVYPDTRLTAIYRQHRGSTSSAAIAEGLYAASDRASARFLRWVERYLAGLPRDRRLDRALASSLRRHDPNRVLRSLARCQKALRRALRYLRRRMGEPSGYFREPLQRGSVPPGEKRQIDLALSPNRTRPARISDGEMP